MAARRAGVSSSTHRRSTPWGQRSCSPRRSRPHWPWLRRWKRIDYRVSFGVTPRWGDLARDDRLFEWTFGSDAMDPRPYCPGAEYVDVIEMDIYNVKGWWQHLRHPCKPWLYLQLAEEHDKPMSFPEWGLVGVEHCGRGGNPRFIRQMASWIRRHGDRVLYHAHFEFHCCLSDHRIKTYPESAAAFEPAFGPR